MGYHINEITRGIIGEISKIQEELDELKDAEQQQCKILALVELSDLYGAIEMYLEKHHKDVTMEDLKQMAALTRSAFESGIRS